MFRLLEDKRWISWIIVLVILITIFYVSSLTFPPGEGGFGYKATAYHVLIFFLLSFFLLPPLVRGKKRSMIAVAIILAVLYGISDEIHQLFVPGRACAFYDVMLDTCGILIASLFYSVSMQRRSKEAKAKIKKKRKKVKQRKKPSIEDETLVVREVTDEIASQA